MLRFSPKSKIIFSALTLVLGLVGVAGAVLFSRFSQDFRGQASFPSPTRTEYDVIVVGGGSGGVAAAIQASRLGATVALVEPTEWLGGQMTAAGVSTMDDAPAEQRYGLYKEFLDRIQREYGSRPISTCYGGGAAKCFEPHIGNKVLFSWLREVQGSTADTGNAVALDVYLNTKVQQAIVSGNTVQGVVLGDNKRLNGKVVIDATEYGDVIPLTPASYRVGNFIYKQGRMVSAEGVLTSAEDACIQDITYTATIRKFGNPTERSLGEKITIPKPPGYGTNGEPAKEFARMVALDTTPYPDGVARFPWDWVHHNYYRGLPDSHNPTFYRPPSDPSDKASITKTVVNLANDYPAYTSSYNAPGTPSDATLPFATEPLNNQRLSVLYLENKAYRQEMNCAAKKKTWNFLYYMQNELGQSDWSLATEENFCPNGRCQTFVENNCADIPDEIEQHLALIPYVRESRRVVGVNTLAAGQIRRTEGSQPQRFTDSIAVGQYPTDLHNCYHNNYLETKLEQVSDWSKSPGPFQIPLYTLIPADTEGFLVAEKNLSQTRLVNGATRLQPTTMFTGQAAGSLAALAARKNVSVKAIPTSQVQAALTATKSRLSLTEFNDVPIDSEYWPGVEFASTRALMAGYGNGKFGPNDPVPREQMAVVLVRYLGLNIDANLPATPTFLDVPNSHWAYKHIEALVKTKITGGCGSSNFCPLQSVSREQLAAFLVRTGKLPNTHEGKNRYTDIPTGNWSEASVSIAVAEGVIKPCTATEFCASRAATRGELAEALRVLTLR